MSASATDDAELLNLIVAGRKEALADLYDRYGRTVYGLALHMVQDHETAEEITQDVFTSIWGKAGTYSADRSQVATWIARIARNRSIDELRRRKVRAEHRSVSWENGIAVEDRHPEEQADLAFQRERVRQAVASLPEKQKQVLALAFFQAYSHSEIAQLLDLPLGTVKTWIRLGMQKLQQLLAAEGYGKL